MNEELGGESWKGLEQGEEERGEAKEGRHREAEGKDNPGAINVLKAALGVTRLRAGCVAWHLAKIW